jgi:chaperonin GroEL
LRCCAASRLWRSSRSTTTISEPAEIVKKALSWPARQIAINAGEDGSIVVGKILEKDAYAFGYDAQTGEYGNLV